jgi:catechol-2,3-dioxygenase
MHLGHVNLYVRDAAASRDWYLKVIGLHTYHFVPGRAAFLSADKEKSHEIALMELGPEAPLQQPGQVGLNHAALMVDSLDQLKDHYRRLKDNNVKLDHISDHGLSLGIYFRDPDGNGLEISFELPREKWPPGAGVRFRCYQSGLVPRTLGRRSGVLFPPPSPRSRHSMTVPPSTAMV